MDFEVTMNIRKDFSNVALVEVKGVVVPDKEVIVGMLQDYKEKRRFY